MIKNQNIGKVLCGVFIFIFTSSILSAQEQDKTDVRQVDPKRPKVGLVLSGGGARGLAHIGVLKWFEEHRIPVDYVGGTSMGGLIGGMYAIGMSPQEMLDFINTINWVATFGTGIRYQELSFRRKEDRRDYPVELELGLKHGLSLPPGLSTGIEINLLIDRVTLPYSTTLTFDDLPIPFFCMGTDILRADQVIMKDGLLSSALRSTMSLPGIFPPVYRNGKWLVDGGVLNNVPTDVMWELNPDVVVAVNVGTPLGTEKSIQSLLGVAGQTIGAMMAGNERKNLELADIVISPELGNVTTADFTAIDKTAELGYPAAEKVSAELLKYALDEAAWKEYTEVRKSRRITTLPVPTGVQVTGVDNEARQEIEAQFQGYAGKQVDIGLLEIDLIKLCGEGRYQSADYGFVIDQSGNAPLQIRITEKTYAPPTINFALVIEGSDISDFNFGFGTRITFFDIWKYGTEWRNDLNAGFGSYFSTEFYSPFGRRGILSAFGLYQQGFFFAPGAFYERGTRDFFSGGERVAEYEVNNYGLSADLGYGTWKSELRIGGQIERFDAELTTGESDFDETKGRSDFGRILFRYDGANNATIPTDGTRLSAEARYYFDSPEAVEEFPWTLVQAATFYPISRKGTIFGQGTVGSTFDKEAAPAQKFALGGPFNLGAYDEGEFTGNNELLFSVGYYHSIFKLPAVIGRDIWVVGWYDIGDAFDDWDNIDFKNEGNIGLLMDTKLGPFAFVIAVGEGASNIYFSFGKIF